MVKNSVEVYSLMEVGLGNPHLQELEAYLNLSALVG